MANNEFIRLENICKVFQKGDGEVVVLNGINLQVHEGEFLTVLGPSRCGKSTLIKIMGGIIPATVGEYYYAGTCCTKRIPKKLLQSIGSVSQQNTMLEWRTVRDNLKLNLEVFGLKGPTWKSRIDEMLALVGLKDYGGIFPYELSGGMQQRAGIARSLVHDPKLLLMDQPFGALDAITRRLLAHEILEIWKDTHKTIVMVTNSVEEALLLSTRIVVMSPEGEIREDRPNRIPLEQRTDDLAENALYRDEKQSLDELVRGR